jgi:hypothetical protein
MRGVVWAIVGVSVAFAATQALSATHTLRLPGASEPASGPSDLRFPDHVGREAVFAMRAHAPDAKDPALQEFLASVIDLSRTAPFGGVEHQPPLWIFEARGAEEPIRWVGPMGDAVDVSRTDRGAPSAAAGLGGDVVSAWYRAIPGWTDPPRASPYAYLVAYSAPAALPLPPGLALLFGALAGLNAFRRRRR